MAIHISFNKESVKRFLLPNKRIIIIWFVLFLIFIFPALEWLQIRIPSNLFQTIPGIDTLRNWWNWQSLSPSSYLPHLGHSVVVFSVFIPSIVLMVVIGLTLQSFEDIYLLTFSLLALTSIEYYLFLCLSIFLWNRGNKKGRLFVTTLLLVMVVSIAVSAHLSYTENQQNSYRGDSRGVIRTSGLQQVEKEKLGLLSSDFQLTDIPIEDPKNSEVHGYYLEGYSSRYKDLIGTCVYVRGRIKKGWQQKELRKQKYMINNQYTYNRSVLIPDSLTKSEDCDPYPPWRKKETSNLQEMFFEGILARTTRPAPDIAYDYELRLLKPVDNPFDASGLRQKRDRVIVIPSENSLWMEMEKKIDQVVTVQGYEKWGYAETSYLYATNILFDMPTRSEAPVLSSRCVPKFIVEISSELTASKAYAQNCYDQIHKAGCEKIDFYNISSKNFINADGIPDCQWIKP